MQRGGTRGGGRGDRSPTECSLARTSGPASPVTVDAPTWGQCQDAPRPAPRAGVLLSSPSPSPSLSRQLLLRPRAAGIRQPPAHDGPRRVTP